jgi:signal transduction histidine kinase
VRRRFTLAIVGVVTGALLIAGVGTLVLLSLKARRTARDNAVALADHIAADYASSTPLQLPAIGTLQRLLNTTDELAIVAIPLRAEDRLPGGLSASDVDALALAHMETVSGYKGNLGFAAVPFLYRGAVPEAVVVSQPVSRTGPAGLYFLLAGGVILAVAFGVAETLARRITSPVVAIQVAAGRMAAGDLSARVAEDQASYPEIHSLAASINAMADNLERLRGQERQFLLSVSHDLRTPLTSIRGFAEALADGTTTDTGKAAGIIAAEARRLERLVRDLLDLAKLDARAFSLDLQPTDLVAVVSDTARGFRPTAAALGLNLVFHQPQGPVAPVLADRDRLAQVVANLVENACTYAAETVEVAVWFRGDEAVVTVDDDGPGIPPEDIAHVFERLWTNRRGQPRQVGSGLGLAIVAELVAAMGGTVRAESPVPRRAPAAHPGSRVIVSLSAHPGDQPRSSTSSTTWAAPSLSSAPEHSPGG